MDNIPPLSTYAPHLLREGLLVAHDLSVVVDGVELAGLDEEGDVARLERREHPGDVRNVNLARAELDLREENGPIINSAASLNKNNSDGQCVLSACEAYFRKVC